MSFFFDVATDHHVLSANNHFYQEPTPPLKIDRTLEDHDLIYLVDGSWSVTENEHEYFLNTGDVLLLTAGNHHYTRNPCAPNTHTFCIHIDSVLQDSESTNGSLHLPTLIHSAGYSLIYDYFNKIVNTFWSHEDHKSLKMSSLLVLLFLELGNVVSSSQNPGNDIADRAMNIVNSNPNNNYPTREVANQLYVSIPTLNAHMKEKVGTTFSTYQKKRRLEMVALAIKTDPDLPLKEIASLYGFYDEFHVSKAFKKHYGVSPKTYRDMLHSNSNDSK